MRVSTLMRTARERRDTHSLPQFRHIGAADFSPLLPVLLGGVHPVERPFPALLGTRSFIASI